MYGSDDAVTIINNCDSYVFMGGMDLKTAQSVSVRLNKPLEDILYMPIGRVIVFRRGQRPVETDRYNIFEDKEYIRITRNHNRRIVSKNTSAEPDAPDMK